MTENRNIIRTDQYILQFDYLIIIFFINMKTDMPLASTQHLLTRKTGKFGPDYVNVTKTKMSESATMIQITLSFISHI